MSYSPPITVVGDALIDEIRDDAGTRELVGGAALNVAVGINRLGGSATLVAMLGEDAAGAEIREYLAEHGVRLAATHSPLGTARATSLRNEQGEPRYEFSPAAQQRHIAFDSVPRGVFLRAEITAVSCFAFDDHEQSEALLRHRATSAMLAIDPNPRAGMMRSTKDFIEGFEAAARHADIIKIGDDDASLLYDSSVDEVVTHLHALGVPLVIATRGKDGATVSTGSSKVHRPIAAMPGRIVDTMGAGDAVFASILVSVLRQRPATVSAWQDILDHAMLVAAATCRSEGALLRLPSPAL